MKLDPPLGVRREYEGDAVKVLYPGEQATATVRPRNGQVSHWVVTPMPGWYGRWLRLRVSRWVRR